MRPPLDGDDLGGDTNGVTSDTRSGGTSDARSDGGNASVDTGGAAGADGTSDASSDADDGGSSVQTCDYNGTTQGVCSNGQYDPQADVCNEPPNYEFGETTCDGLDNDCDGYVNDGCECDFLGRTEGVCNEGSISDRDGSCEPSSDYERDETSCDGLDNDCDGVVDEGCSCNYQSQSNGVCSNGTINEFSGECQAPEDYQDDENTCDAKDNDCDGTVDEGCTCTSDQDCYTGPSNTKGVGICESGTQKCQNDRFGSCENDVTPEQEICDGKDNDCDGVVDEGCACDYQGTSTGVCSEGTLDNNGNCTAPADYSSSESSCDGVDNDCDGTVDEGCSCNYNSNSDGVCGNAKLDSDGNCTEPIDYESDETSCDGKDNDCDGTVDEGCGSCQDGFTEECYTGPAGSAGTGICKKGKRTCTNGSFGSCEDEATPGPESCNGRDDDCDGTTDEGCPCNYNRATEGVCSRGLIGPNGNCLAPSSYSSNETSCDQRDNDCDGVTDENCPCNYNGQSSGVCTNASIDPSSGQCQEPSDYESDESTCDGKDNDCDGIVDEGCRCVDGETQDCYTGPSGTKGTGICESGTQTCNNGSFGTCRDETTPQSEKCDNLDNDCDGTTDEGCQCDYDGTSTGVCSSGTIDSNGNCQAPASYSSDETVCDDKDNDCDGVTDENCPCDYNNTSTGVCDDSTIDASTGQCQKPSDYESDESTCDGKDNDCDGAIDEGCQCDYQGKSTGVCADQTIDSGGNCQEPTVYESTESSCNDDSDNDCDGNTDCADSDCDGPTCGTGLGAICSGGVCAEQSCTDDVDNDLDGDVDCEDSDCSCPSGTMCMQGDCVESNCSNGVDDDGDGNIDCQDSDCASCPSGSTCSSSGECVETNCSNANDDDGDGSTDCDDGDCSGDTCVSGAGSNATCENGSCTEQACRDGQDNDNDGDTDCQDSDCPGCPSGSTCNSSGECVETNCSNGNDDDNDSDVDCVDSDCSGDTCVSGAGSNATCENGSCTEQACRDGQDNDNDGDTDCQDSDCPGCPSGSTCNSSGQCVESNCSNGADDDNDGNVDCADGDCSGDTRVAGAGSNATCESGSCSEQACNDGDDKDNDGDVDCQDSDCPGCPSGSTCGAGGECIEVDCGDGRDNDSDGQTDCADPDCDNDVCKQTGGNTQYCCAGNNNCNPNCGP